ncbi:MAG: P-II family nitrogen regulator [Clostridiales bacterium]|nr:P-II family nitrogen regulator [Clostridiales bacterium]
MVLIRAIIRVEKTGDVLTELLNAGFPAVTQISVSGRGKQKGLQVGNIYYEKIPKEMLLIVVDEEDKDDVIKIIMRVARMGEKGQFGDGRIFVSRVDEGYTISNQSRDF